MRKSMLIAITVLFVRSLGSDALAQEEPKLPPAPPVAKIPGLTEKDEHPRACVDCHKNNPEQKMDARFSTWMKDWTTKGASKELTEKAKKAAPEGMKIDGKHPKIKDDLTTAKIPDSCLECHAKDPKNKKEAGPPFARLVHLVHLTGGKDNHFMTYYQGECTHCHKLDEKTGQWSLGIGTEKK